MECCKGKHWRGDRIIPGMYFHTQVHGLVYIYISALLEHRSKKHTPRKLGSLRLSCPPASTLVCSNPKRAGNGPLLLECLHVFGVRS